MTLRVILEPSEEGGFTVTVPSLPGCDPLKRSTLAHILKQARLSAESFAALR